MDFYQYPTFYAFHHRRGEANEPPAHVYRTWQSKLVASRLPGDDPFLMIAKHSFFEAESQWYQSDSPFYKIWPGVIPLLADVNVEIPCEYLGLPFKCFEVRFPKQENPLRLSETQVVRSFLLYEPLNDAATRRLILLLDTGEVTDRGAPKKFAVSRSCTPGRTLDSIIELSDAERDEVSRGPAMQPDLVAQCFRIAISVCFLATGADKLIEPEVLSDDLARYLEARRNNDVAKVDRLVQKARQRHRHGWNVGQGERFRPLLHREQHDHEGDEGHHAALTHQHQRRAHFRLLGNNKVTFVRQTTVRPDLPPPDRPPGYGLKPPT